MEEQDLVVIGGGAAGYPAASNASQLGAKVLVVEKAEWGGTCVNWGCIPMQFLLQQVGLVQAIKLAEEDGIHAGQVKIDFGRMKSAKDAFIKSMSARIQGNLSAGNIKSINGFARLTSPHSVEIRLDDGTVQNVQTKKIILATGSAPKRLSVKGSNGQGVLTMKEALNLNFVPKSAVIIGGGVIGLEIATLWAHLGCATCIVEILPRLVASEDMDVSLSVEKNLLNQGVRIFTNSEVQFIQDVKEGKSVTIVNEGVTHTLDTQVVVFAMGHSPSVNGLGLADIGVKFDGGGIRTNRRMETNIDGIYAVGDVTGEIMLASVGIVQGMVAAKNAMGGNETMDYRVVPRIIRTIPEIGAIGLTEQEAKKRQIDVKVGKYSLKKNAKAVIQKDCDGFVKIIADAKTEEILGAHIIGSQASELIHGALMIMQTRATIRDVANAIHGHPCLHEAIHRAALGMRH